MPIVAGLLAPHPPHLVYAENPPQNQPRSEGGWEMLRWGYRRLAADLARIDHEVRVVLSPHWQTYVGTHFLGLPRFEGLSVDPVFPHLFRYRYGIDVDVGLSEAIAAQAKAAGLVTAMMRNPDFRVDYGTLVALHLLDPSFSKPVVVISSERSAAWYSVDVMQAHMRALAAATVAAIEASGQRAVLIASNSLSHRHFTGEPAIPEDMTHEHVHTFAGQLWDAAAVEAMLAGRTGALLDQMPEFTEQAVSETDAGALTWLLEALGRPSYPAELYAYGTVIGTGNAVMGWFPEAAR
jgi:2-aminophenol/2-amino-5-chlorophenol 1,6-dioxygenase beta subunit